MKKLVLGAAAAIAFAAPAFAQIVDLEIGPKEREYILREGRSVTVEGDVAVGTVLPGDVEIHTVPDADYRYAVVNDRRVIVDPGTRKVIRIVE